MMDTWKEQTIWLRFRIGEVLLFSVAFPSLVLKIPLSQTTSISPESGIPFERLSSEFETLHIPAQPVNEDLPWLTWLPSAVRYVPYQSERCYVELKGTFKDYLKKFSRKPLHDLERRMRRFAEFSGGVVDWREFSRPDEMEEFYRLALEVSSKTYQERLFGGGLPHSDEFRQRMTDRATCGLARAYVLFHKKRAIAYFYATATDGGNLMAWFTGYDQEFREWHPGKILLYHMLERLFAEGKFQTFDFGGGASFYKTFFSTGNIHCADVYYVRRTARNICLVYLHNGIGSLSRCVTKGLSAVGLKERIKRLIRSKS